jgi:hypothetical protein
MADPAELQIHSEAVTLAANFHAIPETHNDDVFPVVSEPLLPPNSSKSAVPEFQIEAEKHDDNLHLHETTMTRTPAAPRPVDAAAKRDDDLLEARYAQQPPVLTQAYWAAAEVWDNYLRDLNFPRFMYHVVSCFWLCLILYLAWCLLPIRGHWSLAGQSDRVPHQASDLNK